ncbi:hypothetical protein [Candidatus Parabeggiatoa sp. HSG14]|uniref:hypothetical protein n=1 Tax=Candidatus Parabeggiatoa sp. HSG14 TaxID=3055593 RepID=UPI0025A8FA13|nr:hypothetical protein [Thiotrichales bacterium HSG14]
MKFAFTTHSNKKIEILLSDLLSHITETQELDIELSIFEFDLKWTIRDLPLLRTHVVSNYYFKKFLSLSMHNG